MEIKDKDGNVIDRVFSLTKDGEEILNKLGYSEKIEDKHPWDNAKIIIKKKPFLSRLFSKLKYGFEIRYTNPDESMTIEEDDCNPSWAIYKEWEKRK